MNEDALSELTATDRLRIFVVIRKLAFTFGPNSAGERFLAGVAALIRRAGTKEAETWAHLLAGLNDTGDSGEIVPEGTVDWPEDRKPQ
jgi:hypothetical protein